MPTDSFEPVETTPQDAGGKGKADDAGHLPAINHIEIHKNEQTIDAPRKTGVIFFAMNYFFANFWVKSWWFALVKHLRNDPFVIVLVQKNAIFSFEVFWRLGRLDPNLRKIVTLTQFFF